MEENNTCSAIIQDGSADSYCKEIMTAIRQCQQNSTALQGWHHYGDFSGVQKSMKRVDSLIHKVIDNIFSHRELNVDLKGHKLAEKLELLKEGNDALLEKANADIDEASGLRRNIDIQMFDNSGPVNTIRGPTTGEARQTMVLNASRNIQKPQMFFTKKVNNSRKEPFLPLLKEKPNSLKPLAILLCIDDDGTEFFDHPYKYELQYFSPGEIQFKIADPIDPIFLSDTPLELVDNDAALVRMVDELRTSTEIAIDVEHHNFRTYLGLTCIVQVSSRTKDYIIDTLALRGRTMLLNEIFTDPKIVKVLHGSDYDILWLQRDCGLYVVNMFDTHLAAIVLELPHRSLAALLKLYCNVFANKSYQKADWRTRPLPDDFINYARQDSHFLLYIYDILRNELFEKGNEMHNLLNAVYSRSTELCLQRYEKPSGGPDSHVPLYRRSRKHFNSRQMYALKNINLWRDKVARDQDESVEYILPKHMMLQICEVLPKEMQGILACCNPIPIFVKTEQLTIHQIIREAKEQPLTEVSLYNEYSAGKLDGAEEDLAQILITKHDLSQVEDGALSNLSTLLNPHETLLGDLFSNNHVNIGLKKNCALYGKSSIGITIPKFLYQKTPEFQSPYERYLLYEKLHAESEEKNKEEEQEIEPEVEGRMNRLHDHFLSLQESTESDSQKSEGEQKSDAG